MSRWFRHYAGMMRDEKLVRVAIKSKQSVERVLWVWGAMLESAAEIDDNGRYDLDAAEVAYFLRADESDICAIETALADAGRVVAGCVANWGDRQFSSDKSKERQAAYRERKRAEKRGSDSANAKENVTVTSRDDLVTAQETETETEVISSNDDCASGDALKPEHVVEEWNRTAVKLGKPLVRDLTPERRQLLRARIAQYSIDDFTDVFDKMERSAFLRGETPSWPKGATFDWIIKKANFQKTLEGNYDH